MGGISIWQLLIILAIIVLLFGTKKLRNIGADLGGAVKGFKNAMSGEDKDKEDPVQKTETVADTKPITQTSTTGSAVVSPEKTDADKPRV